MLRRYVEQEKIPNFAALNPNERRDAVLKERKIGRRLAAAKSTKAVKSLTKNYRKTEDYIHLTLQERKQVILEAAKLVAYWGDSRLFGEAISKPHFKLPHDPFQEAFMQVVSRFEAFLVNYGKATGRALKGIIVQDNNATEAMRLTRLMRKFQTSGTEWRDINNIVETPLFVDSQLTDMVQVANICAYATRRFFENDEDRSI